MNETFENYQEISKIINRRLDEFSKINNKKEVFYELCFCLLTPQSNAKRCDEAVKIFRSKRFYDFDFKIDDIKSILKGKTRFHNNKADYLLNVKSVFEELWNNFDFLNKSLDVLELREWLVKNVKGLGYKEASHFLRNVGYRGLAILDRHILRNLSRLEVIDTIPKNMPRNKYLLIEKNFKEFSNKTRLKIDELDLYFWYCETGEVFK